MGTHPTFAPSTGPNGAYQPKTTDESDVSVAGGVVPHVNAQQSGAWVTIQAPFRPIPLMTKSVTVGPTATAAGSLPLAAAGAIPAGTATSYRVRNPSASTSAITWILTTDNTKTPVIPTPYAADGTGGTLGDKTIDPGSVEVISLSAAQQTALAAGTLYISAVTPSAGSGILSITPGVGA